MSFAQTKDQEQVLVPSFWVVLLSHSHKCQCQSQPNACQRQYNLFCFVTSCVTDGAYGASSLIFDA